MGLSNALHIAYSGLAVSTLRTNVAANNIANASTEGYVRRTLDVAAVSLDGLGAGVRADGLVLAENPALTADRREADAEAGQAEVLAEARAVLARLIGDASDPAAMTERYAGFESSLRALADDPGATFLQNDVINSADYLIDGFADMQEDLLDLREDADAEIATLVNEVNAVLEEIHNLNIRIRKTNNVNGDTGEMQAERGRLIDQMTEILPVKVYQQEHGGVLVTTDTGHTLVGEAGYNEITFSQANAVAATSDYLNGVGGMSGLTLSGIDITPPTSTALTSGKLAGLFEVRDVMSLEFQDQIDALAQDLISRFEDVEVTAQGMFVDPGSEGARGLAGRLALNAAVDPDQGGSAWRLRDGLEATSEGDSGDNTLAQRMLEAMTENRTYAGNTAGAVFVSSADAAVASHATTLYSASTEVADSTGLTAVYSLTDDAGGVFQIDATTGAVSLAPAQTLSSDTTYSVTIQSLVGHDAVLYTGVNAGTGVTHILTVDAGGLFEVDAATGEVSLVAGETINFDTATSYSVTIQSTDGVTTWNETVTITAEQILETSGVTVETETVTIAVSDRVSTTGGYSAFDLMATVTSLVSTNSVNADRTATLRSSQRAALATQEISETGVNLDQELAALQEIQTAYAANARVVQAIDELMRILLEI